MDTCFHVCSRAGGSDFLPSWFIRAAYICRTKCALNVWLMSCLHVCAGVHDDSPESVLCCVWFPGDLSLGCHGGLSPARAQAAGLARRLRWCFCRGTGGCCNDHSSWKVGSMVHSPGVCGVSETLWSLSNMETNYISISLSWFLLLLL